MLNIIKNKKNFITDVLLNVFASFLMSGTMQLLIYPYLAQILSADEYGKFLTLIGISNIIAVTLGGSLNNVRLLKQTEYNQKGIIGDFNYLSIVSCIIILIIIPIIIIIFGEDDSFVLLTLITVLTFVRSYYSVGYCIILDFKKYLAQSIIYCFGGIVGLLFLQFTQVWQWPFILAELFACIYILLTTNLIREPNKITILFNSALKDYLYLIFTSFVGNALIYLDRLLLYPLLGGENVSIYFVATFFGKTFGVVMLPIAGVLLSYYAQKKSITLKQFWLQSGISIIFCFLFFFISLLIAKPITGFLYPTLINDAVNYLPIANLSAIILVASSIVQPAVLKFCKTIYQPLIQITHFIAYIGLGLLFLNINGLMGFCVAALIANTIKLAMLLIIGHLSIKKNEIILNKLKSQFNKN